MKRRESISKALRRLAAERAEAALQSLQHYERAEAIHGVRKDIKKVRAVLRLARERIPKKCYRHQTELLRKAANRLAPARDAYVLGAALNNLTKHFPGKLDRVTVRNLGKRIQHDLATAEERFARKKSATKVKRLLKRIPKELRRLEIEAKGWEVISAGLMTAFTRGRAAYLLAWKGPSPERLHEWRKRAKDLWYQLRVLRPIYPEQMDALASDLKALTEHLGDDHDLLMLEQSVGADPVAPRELFEPAILQGMIEQRRRELQSAALKLGGQIYAENPAVFCGRLARYWKRWRGGEKDCVRSERG